MTRPLAISTKKAASKGSRKRVYGSLVPYAVANFLIYFRGIIIETTVRKDECFLHKTL